MIHFTPKSIQLQNDRLRAELGTKHNLACYKWIYSESDQFIVPVVLLNDDGQIIYDYVCNCGRNKAVHLLACQGFTIPRPRWEWRKMSNLEEQWVLCCWVEPPNRDDWTETFGTDVAYPARGQYVPVGTLGTEDNPPRTVCLPPNEIPVWDMTNGIIDMIRNRPTRREVDAETKKRWAKQEAARKQTMIDRFTDAAPVGSGYPGTKEDFSAGGHPDIESPLIRKLNEKEIVN